MKEQFLCLSRAKQLSILVIPALGSLPAFLVNPFGWPCIFWYVFSVFWFIAFLKVPPCEVRSDPIPLVPRPPFGRRQRYAPRQTDAGRWVEAPIAEVDKSTMGKLLASRMRREPGLHVVVRGNAEPLEPIRQDALYDAELDG